MNSLTNPIANTDKMKHSTLEKKITGIIKKALPVLHYDSEPEFLARKIMNCVNNYYQKPLSKGEEKK